MTKFSIRAWIRQRVSEVVSDDEKRFRLQMIWVLRIVSIIVLVMTLVNLITQELTSIVPTGLFGLISLLVTLVIDKRPQWRWLPMTAMTLAISVLFTYYIISGEPEGFSPIWSCIVPPVALLLLGRGPGGAISVILFVLMAFLMWMPWGRSLLQYPYEESFLIRLPLVYIAAFWVSWFLEYVREVTQKKLMETQRNLEHLYRHDALTGAMNRHGFNERIGCAARATHPEGLALMFIDLDDFKHTNDAYGHPAGDAVLREMAGTIQRVIGGVGEVSRWGGEEFAVLMNRASGAREMAEALRAAIAAIRVPAGVNQVQVTVSIGLTVVNGERFDQERLVTLTDTSLYRAKENGKDQVAWGEYSDAE